MGSPRTSSASGVSPRYDLTGRSSWIRQCRQSLSSHVPCTASAPRGVPHGGQVEAEIASSWTCGASPENRLSLSHTFPSPVIGGEINCILFCEKLQKYKIKIKKTNILFNCQGCNYNTELWEGMSMLTAILNLCHRKSSVQLDSVTHQLFVSKKHFSLRKWK